MLLQSVPQPVAQYLKIQEIDKILTQMRDNYE